MINNYERFPQNNNNSVSGNYHLNAQQLVDDHNDVVASSQQIQNNSGTQPPNQQPAVNNDHTDQRINRFLGYIKQLDQEMTHPCLTSNMYNFIFMNSSHLFRYSFRDKSKVKFLGGLTGNNTLFVGLTETFLNSNILDSENLMEGFNIVWRDRNGRTGGGVCVYLKQSVSHKFLLSYCNSTCEVLIVKIREPEVILVMMYRPPNASTSAFNDIIKRSENTIRDLDSPLPEIVIMGNFNFPGVLWTLL